MKVTASLVKVNVDTIVVGERIYLGNTEYTVKDILTSEKTHARVLRLELSNGLRGPVDVMYDRRAQKVVKVSGRVSVTMSTSEAMSLTKQLEDTPDGRMNYLGDLWSGLTSAFYNSSSDHSSVVEPSEDGEIDE